MATHTLTLEIPDEVYKDLQQQANSFNRSIEDLVLQRVTTESRAELHPAEIEQLLESMTFLDVVSLWKAARSRLPTKAAKRLTALNDKNQREGLTTAEQTEQAELMRQYERFMLIRAQAALLLKEQGQDVSKLGYKV